MEEKGMSEPSCESLTEDQLRAVYHLRTGVSNALLEKERELAWLRNQMVALDRAIKLLEAAQ
jgi:hypothetical protein